MTFALAREATEADKTGARFPCPVAVGIETWTIPTPFPVGGVNAYRLEGPRAALIDCGPRAPEAREALLSHLRARPVRDLVVTHEHVDHAGLARTLQAQGVEVILHRREARTLETWNEAAAQRERLYEAGLVAAGVPPEHRERMRYGGRKYDHWSETVHPDRLFEGGDRLPLGTRTLEVHDAPGHTPGSFLLSDGDVTFTGDTLLETITPNAISVRADERGALRSYLDTLRRLQPRDWGTLLPGHGRPFTGADAIIHRALRHAEVRQDRMLRELATGPRTAFELVQRLFPHILPDQYFLATSEVLGHLGLLEIEGRIQSKPSDGVESWSRATQP